ncbi:MAG: hypothetical protein ACE5D7_06500 [Fidelibacterota bacterium]
MSNTKIVTNFILTFLLIIYPVFSQGQSSRIPQIDSVYPGSTFTNSFLNSNRVHFTQSLMFTTSSGNGITTSAGIYSNHMTYQFSDKLRINTGFNIISPISNSLYSQQKPTVDFDIEMNYSPSENLNFKLGFSKVNSDNLYLYHRMGRF